MSVYKYKYIILKHSIIYKIENIEKNNVINLIFN